MNKHLSTHFSVLCLSSQPPQHTLHHSVYVRTLRCGALTLQCGGISRYDLRTQPSLPLALFTISYHAEYEIFTHLRAAGVVAGVTWITDQVLRSTNTQAPSSQKQISRTTTTVLSPRYESP